jgi:hypothetical protein
MVRRVEAALQGAGSSNLPILTFSDFESLTCGSHHMQDPLVSDTKSGKVRVRKLEDPAPPYRRSSKPWEPSPCSRKSVHGRDGGMDDLAARGKTGCCCQSGSGAAAQSADDMDTWGCSVNTHANPQRSPVGTPVGGCGSAGDRARR